MCASESSFRGCGGRSPGGLKTRTTALDSPGLLPSPHSLRSSLPNNRDCSESATQGWQQWQQHHHHHRPEAVAQRPAHFAGTQPADDHVNDWCLVAQHRLARHSAAFHQDVKKAERAVDYLEHLVAASADVDSYLLSQGLPMEQRELAAEVAEAYRDNNDLALALGTCAQASTSLTAVVERLRHERRAAQHRLLHAAPHDSIHPGQAATGSTPSLASSTNFAPPGPAARPAAAASARCETFRARVDRLKTQCCAAIALAASGKRDGIGKQRRSPTASQRGAADDALSWLVRDVSEYATDAPPGSSCELTLIMRRLLFENAALEKECAELEVAAAEQRAAADLALSAAASAATAEALVQCPALVLAWSPPADASQPPTAAAAPTGAHKPPGAGGSTVVLEAFPSAASEWAQWYTRLCGQASELLRGTRGCVEGDGGAASWTRTGAPSMAVREEEEEQAAAAAESVGIAIRGRIHQILSDMEAIAAKHW